ncbi:MAG: competence/damage-inducible protein A [Armatimonadota bacterium]|nr:competence/damage-inducible protein A [Armatimonadota bacterium]
MIAETISVGTELLLGQTVDTDAVFLAQMLSRMGISIYFRTTVGDNEGRIKEAIRLALSRADLVITVGGLGPTQDDLTKEMVADVLGVGLVEDTAHARWLQERFGERGGTADANFYKQALVPQSGRGLPNPNGTALGALFEKDSKLVLCLPGPPNELMPMTEESVEPFLRERTAGQRTVIQSRTLRIVGMGESLIEDRVRDLMTGANPTVAPYAKTGEMHLRLTTRAASETEAEALIAPIEAEIRERLGDLIYGVDDETLEKTVVGLLALLGQTLATGESCSGGLIAKRLTDVPDASKVFGLGLVAYSNAAKTRLLGVSDEFIERVGAVSPEVARAMAEGARKAAQADLGVSVTGIAGPGGGSPEKPVGTVHVGLAWDGGATSESHHFLGRRADIAYRSSQAALALVRRFLLNPDDRHFRPGEDG